MNFDSLILYFLFYQKFFHIERQFFGITNRRRHQPITVQWLAPRRVQPEERRINSKSEHPHNKTKSETEE